MLWSFAVNAPCDYKERKSQWQTDPCRKTANGGYTLYSCRCWFDSVVACIAGLELVESHVHLNVRECYEVAKQSKAKQTRWQYQFLHFFWRRCWINADCKTAFRDESRKICWFLGCNQVTVRKSVFVRTALWPKPRFVFSILSSLKAKVVALVCSKKPGRFSFVLYRLLSMSLKSAYWPSISNWKLEEISTLLFHWLKNNVVFIPLAACHKHH